MSTTGLTTVNGVNVDQMMTTIEHIQQQPDLANFTFRARTEWQNGAHTRSRIKGFYGAGREDESRTEPLELVGDEPAILLGKNHGPNSVEVVLHALASCLAVGLIYNASARGIEVHSLDMDVEGDVDLHRFLGLSEETRAGFEGITLRYRVAADATKDEIEQLCAHVQNTSPVLDILTNPVPVTISMEASTQ